MDVFECIAKRASVRAFKPCDVPEGDLLRIIDAGRIAPSGMNKQPREFIAVRDKETIKKLGVAQACIAEASAAIAVVIDEAASGLWKEDASASIENMLLAATALGYASLWSQGRVIANEAAVREILGVPENLFVMAVIPIGKAAKSAPQAEKRPFGEVVHFEKYGRHADK